LFSWQKVTKNIDDSSCTTQIIVQSDALWNENAPPPNNHCKESSKSWLWWSSLDFITPKRQVRKLRSLADL